MLHFQKYLFGKIDAAPLAIFRILFGLIMAISMIRFWYNGWIEKLYIEPDFHFKYLGFEWVAVPKGIWCYLLFILCGISALLISLGWKYKVSTVLFFLSFCYIELMDKTTYLNHYYFVSIIGFILIFIPTHCYLSIDAYHNRDIRASSVPRWILLVLKCMIAIVYIYAGLAKLNYDWIMRAMPLALWLPSKSDIPIIGSFLSYHWVAYLFSWAGAIYDLTIPFFLSFKTTRNIAFIAVVFFHVLTRILFPIGMFPYIMIVGALIFFSPRKHREFVDKIASLFKVNPRIFNKSKIATVQPWKPLILCALLFTQILLPWRYLLYDNHLFWNEQGYRFGWRVMLMEKTGHAEFVVKDNDSGQTFKVQNSDFLTPFQEKQMATQPDFIIEYAHHLGHHFKRKKGMANVEVYVESYAALNGRSSQLFVHPDVNLLEMKNNLKSRTYVVPFLP